MSITIPELNYDIFMTKPFRMIIFGSSGSGKTHFLESAIWPNIRNFNTGFAGDANRTKEKRFDKVVVFTPAHNNSRYKKFYYPEVAEKIKREDGSIGENIMIYNDVSTYPEIINAIKTRQISDVVMHKKDGVPVPKLKEDGNPVYKYDILMIFDDILDKKFVNSDEVANLFATFRNINISTVFIIQDVAVFTTPMIRAQMTVLVLCKLLDKKSRNIILREYIAPSLDAFMKESDPKYDPDTIEELCEELYKSIVEGHKWGKLIAQTEENLLYKYVSD
jgi:hypothetical protein